MSIKPQVLDLIRLVEDGKMLDAITTYYDRAIGTHTRDAMIFAAATHQSCWIGGCGADAWTLYQVRRRR